ncbi:hypothetical protein FDECE_5138 [Fusarium decemcellulare]|nr:hypothetical protein FDECE_5138 [Fusarium decemcellulare]
MVPQLLEKIMRALGLGSEGRGCEQNVSARGIDPAKLKEMLWSAFGNSYEITMTHNHYSIRAPGQLSPVDNHIPSRTQKARVMDIVGRWWRKKHPESGGHGHHEDQTGRQDKNHWLTEFQWREGGRAHFQQVRLALHERNAFRFLLLPGTDHDLGRVRQYFRGQTNYLPIS